MKKVLDALKKYFADFFTSIRKGDIWTKLSLIIMGSGYIARKQIIKGILITAIEVFFFAFTLGFSLEYIGKLNTLGTVQREEKLDLTTLTKTVNAAVVQIEAINFIKKMKKYEELPDSLIEVAELRVKYPEMSLKDLGKMIENPIGKSGVNHRLKKIVEFADEIKRGK